MNDDEQPEDQQPAVEQPEDESPEKDRLRPPSRPPPPGPPRVSWPTSSRLPKPINEPAKPRSRPGTMRHGPPPT